VRSSARSSPDLMHDRSPQRCNRAGQRGCGPVPGRDFKIVSGVSPGVPPLGRPTKQCDDRRREVFVRSGEVVGRFLRYRQWRPDGHLSRIAAIPGLAAAESRAGEAGRVARNLDAAAARPKIGYPGKAAPLTWSPASTPRTEKRRITGTRLGPNSAPGTGALGRSISGAIGRRDDSLRDGSLSGRRLVSVGLPGRWGHGEVPSQGTSL
jgi:hypothetical protein